MHRPKKAPPKIYWIRVAVEADCMYPAVAVEAQVKQIRKGLHILGASFMTESALLALIECAIHAEVVEEETSETNETKEENDEQAHN